MASAVYRKFKQQVLQHGAGTNLSSGTVRAVLVDTGTYTFSHTHQYASSLSGVMQGGSVTDAVGAYIEMSGKTFTDGVFSTSDASDTFQNPTATGTTYEALVFYVWVTAASDSPLVALVDLPGAVRPNGDDIIVEWDSVTTLNGQTGGIFGL